MVDGYFDSHDRTKTLCFLFLFLHLIIY